MKFNANDYVNEHLTAEEVHEIKVGFDLFDRDMGGAIDPRGNFYLLFLNSESLSPPSVSIQKPSQSIKWWVNSIRTEVVCLNLGNFWKWWPPDQRLTIPENKFTKFLSLLTRKEQVICFPIQDTSVWMSWEKSLRSWESWLMTMFFKKWSKEPITIKTVSFLKKMYTFLWQIKFSGFEPSS